MNVKKVIADIAATAISAAVAAVTWKGVCAAWSGCRTLGHKVADKVVSGSGKSADKNQLLPARKGGDTMDPTESTVISLG